jgi:hypothetical protein
MPNCFGCTRACVAAAVAVVAAGAAGVKWRHNSTAIVFGESTAEPSRPIELSSNERDAVLAKCSGTADSVGIVDARPDGVLVGQFTGEDWSTCLFSSAAPTRASTTPIRTTEGAGARRLQPVALGGRVSPSRPIVVIDAHAPQGNQVDGTETTWVWGRIDPSIATIIVSTRSGRYVPTVINGLFAAWWRGNNGDEAIVVGGQYVEGGCRGGANVKPGATDKEIGD